MYRTAKNMRRVQAFRKINYKAAEIQRANASLAEAVGSGSLQWLKAKFEHYALEAVPNVWEGDEGMMKHVPKFPMPPCIALPIDRVDAVAALSADQMSDEEAEMFEKDDMAIAIASSGTTKDYGAELKRRGMERGFWIKMAKVVMCVESMNQSIMTLRNKFANEYEKIMKQDCQELVNLYKQMRKIKFKLDKAVVDYKKNEFTNLFTSMTPSQKIWFKRRHKIQGKLPNSVGSILKKYNFVRTKIREVLHKNPERFEEFKDILTNILKDAYLKANKDTLSLKIVEETEENKNGEASCLDADGTDKTGDKRHSDEELDEEGKSKKRKTENVVDDAEDPDAMLSREDLFWENLTGLKKMMHKAAINLSRLNSAAVPDATKVFRKNGSVMCRQMLNVRKSIISFTSNLVKLKEEMQTNNYEDKKPFTAEELASEGIEGLTPDNSLAVVETMLNKIKDDYLKVQDEKYFILEKFGYTKDLQLELGSIDQKVQVQRVCSHSKTAVDLEALGRLAEGPSKFRRRNLRESAGNQHTLNVAGVSKEATATPAADVDGQENASVGEANAGADDSKSENPSVGEANAGADESKSENPSSENAPVDSAGQDVPVDEKPAGEDSTPIDVDAAGDDDASDDSSPEDDSNLSRNVNSLSFFMKNLAPDALTVSEQSSVPAGDFVEKERQYWDRLQELLRTIDNARKKVRAKSRISYFRKRQIREAMNSCHQRLKQLTTRYELAKVEAFRCGYCTHVVYENLEFQSDTAAALLVRDLDQVKQRINTLYRCCRETAVKLGVPHMCKL